MAIHLLRSLVRGRSTAARIACFAWIGCCAATLAVAEEHAAEERAAQKPAGVCQPGQAGRHGTQVNWVATAEQASRQAAEQDKLVFLMQISGNFAREEFT